MDQELRQDLRESVPLVHLANLIVKKGDGASLTHLGKEEVLDKIAILEATDQSLVDELNSLLVEFKFAGKGSISWSVPVGAKHFTKDELEELLSSRFDRNPFQEEIKPEITRKPALNKAVWQQENLLKLEFVYGTNSYYVEEGYQLRKVSPMKRIYAFIRLSNSSFIVEARASLKQAFPLHIKISNILGIDTKMMEFANLDIDKIRDGLVAQKKAAKTKRFAGDIDVITVSAAPTTHCLDLSSEYRDLVGTDEIREARFEFKYEYPSGAKSNITFHVSSKGSVWFVSAVPEEIIEYVFSIVRSIKGF